MNPICKEESVNYLVPPKSNLMLNQDKEDKMFGFIMLTFTIVILHFSNGLSVSCFAL